MKPLRCTANWIAKWKLLGALFCVSLALGARATIPLYQNLDVSEYEVYLDTISQNPPPTIDAKAFDNENLFSVSFQSYYPTPLFYQTWNTVNYTNVSTLTANNPGYTNETPGTIFVGFSYTAGYQFDLHTTNQIPDAMAGTIYNPGTIRCESTLDGNSLYDLGGGVLAYAVTSLGQFKGWATNIMSPGVIDVGVGGLIQLTGQNVDLTGGNLNIEPYLTTLGSSSSGGALGTPTLNSIGAIGIDNNGDWDPGVDLTPTEALSSIVPVGPGYLFLTNSRPYLDVRTPSPNYNIYRYVFIQDANNPGVTYNVYVDAPNTVSLGFQAGAAHVEWTGTYTDPATGNPVTSYLYLTDDYLLGARTNTPVLGGVPENFTFVTSSNQLLFGPTPQDIPFTPLPDLVLSNNYAVMFGSLVPGIVTTNASLVDPGGSITNLPGAIKITANKNLNLANAIISGASYLAVDSTNQFNGSPGATISVPFADIYLGVTNGFLTVSNILSANIPNWTGTIDAWSTVFTNVDTTVTPNITNDYRVLLVFSSLKPVSSPWIKNLHLFATNMLTISDPLYAYGSLYSDAQALVLNTNQLGVGANSVDGELTWLNNLPFNANSGSGVQQMPNLLWLTNNGVIRVLHNSTFGNSAMPQFTVTPAVAAVRASGRLSEIGTNAVLNDVVTIGTNHYTFVNVLANGTGNQIKWATNFDASMGNLIAAINGAAGSGTKYSSATKSNKLASAGALSSHAFTVTAITAGSGGNTIPTLFTPATIASNLTWSGNVTLTNGADYIPAVTNYVAFINHGLLADQGTALWTTYFENDGTVSNGTGSFSLHCGTGMLTNGNLVADGDVTLSVTNNPGMGFDSLIISNHMIQAGRKLTLVSTNITDTGVTNGNIWVVGATSGGGAADSGFNIPLMPPAGAGDLLGTTVTNIAPPSKAIYNVWAGTNYGLSTRGYANNLAVGQLVFDVQSPSSFQYVNGVGANNAIYVDRLVLNDSAANLSNPNNLTWLKIGTNMIIYFAEAIKNGSSVSRQIDQASLAGLNSGGRLRWIYSYAGYFSSTNIVFTNADGTVSSNLFNAALAQDATIDSDADGTANAFDATPFFFPSETRFKATVTNLPPKSTRIQWATIPDATNFVYYATNLAPANWMPLTNFTRWYFGNSVAVTNPAHVNYFRSPQIYINNSSIPDNGQQTNVWIYDAITNVPHYYRVVVWPMLYLGE